MNIDLGIIVVITVTIAGWIITAIRFRLHKAKGAGRLEEKVDGLYRQLTTWKQDFTNNILNLTQAVRDCNDRIDNAFIIRKKKKGD